MSLVPYNLPQPNAIVSSFEGEQSEQHGGYLHWTIQVGGLPLRTKSSATPLLTKEEIQNELVLVSECHQATFDLARKEDRFVYKWVWDRIINGWFQLIHIERYWDEREKKPYVYMEWAQVYAQLPDKGSR